MSFEYYSVVRVEDVTEEQADWVRACIDGAVEHRDALYDPSIEPSPQFAEIAKEIEQWPYATPTISWDAGNMEVDGWGVHYEVVAVFLQAALRRFWPDRHIVFEWSTTANVPGECYGGATLVTATEITSRSTDVLARQLSALVQRDRRVNLDKPRAAIEALTEVFAARFPNVYGVTGAALGWEFDPSRMCGHFTWKGEDLGGLYPATQAIALTNVPDLVSMLERELELQRKYEDHVVEEANRLIASLTTETETKEK